MLFLGEPLVGDILQCTVVRTHRWCGDRHGERNKARHGRNASLVVVVVGGLELAIGHFLDRWTERGSGMLVPETALGADLHRDDTSNPSIGPG